jgi:uncharacterized protein (UPF0332 family)
MTLQNLVRIGKLNPHTATREEVTKLFAAARRSLEDSRVKGISPEARFDLAYKSVMQCSMTALIASGFRPSTSEPGHHALAIQSLAKTIDLPSERVIVLDKLRRVRNLSDYSGDGVSEEEADSCIRAAERLLADVEIWLPGKYPEFS